MQKVIEIAIENGYKTEFHSTEYERYGAWILLDPDFWQALVKGVSKDNYYNYEIRPADSNFYEQGHWNEWQYQWCSFTSHLANGGDINEYFEELCKGK